MGNLPIKSDNTFFNKIKNWFKNKFYKNQENKAITNLETISIQNDSEEQKNSFINQYNAGTQKRKVSKEDVRKAVENNPLILNRMSLQQLNVLEEYYDELILKESGNKKSGNTSFKFSSKEDIRMAIERNPNFMDNFSLEQLNLLEKYYDELIVKVKKVV